MTRLKSGWLRCFSPHSTKRNEYHLTAGDWTFRVYQSHDNTWILYVYHGEHLQGKVTGFKNNNAARRAAIKYMGVEK